MDAKLINLRTGETVILNKPVFRLGRERSYVDYVVADAAVSRSHCDLVCREDIWYVMDINSTNHTYLNGDKLIPNRQERLRNGDKLTLADVDFTFRCAPKARDWQVFITCRNTDGAGRPTQDREMAESLYEALTAKGIRAFYAIRSMDPENTKDYIKTIDKALNKCSILVAVGTSLENLESKWVESEIQQFRTGIYNGVKAFGTSTIISYCPKDLTPSQLPMALRTQQSFTDQGRLISFIEYFLKSSTGQSGGEVW